MRLALVALLLAGCGGAAVCDYCPGAASTRNTAADVEIVNCACPSHAGRSMGFTVPDTPRDCGESQSQWSAYLAKDCVAP